MNNAIITGGAFHNQNFFKFAIVNLKIFLKNKSIYWIYILQILANMTILSLLQG